MSRLPPAIALQSVISVAIACGQGTLARSLDPTNGAAPDNPTSQAVAPKAPRAPALDWKPCGNGFECANAQLPRDYSDYDANSARLAASNDQFITLQALEQNWESDIEAFILRGEWSRELFPHLWWNSGHAEFALGPFPIEAFGLCAEEVGC